MLIRFSAVHFCDAVTSIPINSIVWVSKYTQPESECLLPSFHRPLMNNHITLKIIVARRGDSLYSLWYLQYRAQSECCLSLSDWCRKVEKDKCSLRIVLLAGFSIRRNSPHPENLLIALQICCKSSMQCSNWLKLRKVKDECTQHNMLLGEQGSNTPHDTQ